MTCSSSQKSAKTETPRKRIAWTARKWGLKLNLISRDLKLSGINQSYISQYFITTKEMHSPPSINLFLILQMTTEVRDYAQPFMF